MTPYNWHTTSTEKNYTDCTVGNRNFLVLMTKLVIQLKKNLAHHAI